MSRDIQVHLNGALDGLAGISDKDQQKWSQWDHLEHLRKATSAVTRPRAAKNWHNLNELLTIKMHCSSWLEKKLLRSLFIRISCCFYICIDDAHKHARSAERDGHLHLDERKLTATQAIMHNAALQLWKPHNNYIQKELYFRALQLQRWIQAF